MNVLKGIAAGYHWIATRVESVSEWLPKALKIVKSVEADAPVILPELETVIEDVDALAIAFVKDEGTVSGQLTTLVLAIGEAYAEKGVNVTQDIAVATAFEAFIKAVTSSATYADFLTAEAKLIKDYNTLGAASKMAIAGIVADVK